MEIQLDKIRVRNTSVEMSDLGNLSMGELRKEISWPKFDLGEISYSAQALDALKPSEIARAIQKHGDCDWGDLDGKDCEKNGICLKAGLPVTGLHHADDGTVYLVHTDLECSLTEVLLAKEI